MVKRDDMEVRHQERLFEVLSDLRTARGHLKYVSHAPSAYRRLFAQFESAQRISILNAVHEGLKGQSVRTDRLDLFVADCFIDSKPESLHDLNAHTVARVAQTLAGTNPQGLATVVTSQLQSSVLGTELYSLLSAALGTTVLEPKQAAALIACLDASSNDIERLRAAPDYLQHELSEIPRRTEYTTFSEHMDDPSSYALPALVSTHSVAKAIEAFESAWMKAEGSLRSILDSQMRIVRPAALCDKFCIDPEPSELYVPPRRRLMVAQTMRDAVAQAEKSKDSLLAMSPREFERFMAHVFASLGYSVELTKATRDGGTDLLCLRSIHGIPFRLAVEVKRYKESRPVDVTLIRAFVGANREFQAHRLLFVTTSGYTGPAMAYAEKYAEHLLTLKDYEQISEWCREVRRRPLTLFG